MFHSRILIGVVLAFVPGVAAAEESAALKIAAKLRSGEPVRVVCFGDSVTGVYYHTGGRRAYTDMLGIALRKAFSAADVTTINAGISGHTTANGLARLEKDVLAHKPALVTVMFGLNDMTRVPLDEYRANLKTIIEKCGAAGAEVLLATPNNVIDTSSRPTAKLITYCKAIHQVGHETGTPVCDCYAALELVRTNDALAWRLMMSDEIHPNMAGHKRIAESLAHSITGQDVSLADIPPPSDPLAKTLALLKANKLVKILAMPPLDEQIGAALKETAPEANLDITSWPTAGKSVGQIEKDAQVRVRTMKPNLVLIAVPRMAAFEPSESFIRSYSWIMNWSLSFGVQEWDCVVVHPAVIDPAHADEKQDALVRQLVRAQDLTLIDRAEGDKRPAAQLLSAWLQQQGK
jgi:lysophospholipase L1-like esterase